MSKPITTITAKELGLHGVKRYLIVVQPNMLIRDALDVMSRNHITSLPIYSHSSTQITSIVNLFDILIHLVKDSKTVEFDEEEFRRLSEPLENVLGLDGDMESYRLHKSYDDDQLIDTLRAFASGIHRSIVIDPSDKAAPWLLSQTDILRYAQTNPECLTTLGIDLEMKIENLFDHRTPPKLPTLITASPTDMTIEVYKKMGKNKIAAMPIIDEGKIISDISIEDLPSADLTKPNHLSLPCYEFVKGLNKKTSLVLSKDETLRELLNGLINSHVHRAWISNSSNKGEVESVISMSDIISYICHCHQAHPQNIV
ncbi:hypothetical protein INT43_002216 [Umbelopsis isabellina]|uniref:CBS domain-containing protein n=1 Tax=Mortierella isabellina TaxID=91625 RepID=A0A8H7Q664_MORIS|nr:hypothetical protein INT43_002216 [Umbelopsis isabellina]